VPPCVGCKASIAVFRPLYDAAKYLFFIVSIEQGISSSFFKNVSRTKRNQPLVSAKYRKAGTHETKCDERT
jgi:hypothetical protein